LRVKQTKSTYFVFKSWKMALKSYIRVLLGLLLIALIAERYCFAVAVYSARGYGFMLILFVSAFNTVFLAVI